MATVKVAYSSATTITCSIASLAAQSGRESASIDNTTNLYLDALVQVKTKMGGTGPLNDKAIYIYAAGSDDSGTTWPDTVTGSDAAITVNSPTQLRLIGTIFVPTASTAYISEPCSVAAAFGGQLPPKWSIVIVNSSSVLDSTAGNHALQYVGITQTVA